MRHDFPSLKRAFTLVEILGAVAVLAVLAGLATLSIRDSVVAGQKAAMQRELQTLNTSLQNFKSAGGTFEGVTDAAGAVDRMRGGVDLSGSGFTPLTMSPDFSKELGGDLLTLNFDPDTGFSYRHSSGDGSLGGVLADPGVSNPVSLFQMTDEGVLGALEFFVTLSPGDQNYNQYLADLGLAMTPEVGLSTETVAAIESTMAGLGLTYNLETWGWETAQATPTPKPTPTPQPVASASPV
jgi:prepilin-type N-terminal cleavage/methylation domain-containing protein